MNILLLDDEKMITSNLKDYLNHERPQWYVSVANSYTEAIDLCHAIIYDCVVADVKLQGGVHNEDGARFCRYYKSLNPGTVTILITGTNKKYIDGFSTNDIYHKALNMETLLNDIERRCYMSDKCEEHSGKIDTLNESVTILVNNFEHHTKMITAAIDEIKEDNKKWKEAWYDKPGYKTMLLTHHSWFKWVGVVATGIVTWLLKTELFN